MSWRLSVAVVVVVAGGVGAAWYYLPERGGPEVVAKAPPALQPQVQVDETELAPMPKPDPTRKDGLGDYHMAVATMFAQTPGFGMDRIPAMLRKIEEHAIFWSPGELDTESAYSKQPQLAKANEGFQKYFMAAKGDRKGFFEGDLRGYWLIPVPGTESKGAESSSGHENVVANSKAAKAGLSKSWRIERIDLVGLMEPENPVVYVSARALAKLHSFDANGNVLEEEAKKFEEGPNGKLLPKYARVPDFFELAAIERLTAGDKLFVRHKDNIIRMMGPLQATSQCLKCHNDWKEGDILGALSYTLRSSQ